MLLPRDNGVLTQYNGLTVTHDGMLVLKGWSLTAGELELVRARIEALGFGAAAGLEQLLKLARRSGLARVATRSLPWLDRALRALGVDASLQEFISAQQTGSLLLVDPETLSVEQTAPVPERLPFARMCMLPQGLDAEHGAAAVETEYLVVPGEQSIHRWRYTGGRLYADPDWSERYRHHGDGSFVGTGPAACEQQVYYTDNTAPIGLRNGYRAYRKSLCNHEPQQVATLTQGDPGFMFWSSVVDPLHQLVFTWDTASGWIEARGADDFERRWRVALLNTDCCAVQARHGHLYATDHHHRLASVDLLRSVARRPQRRSINKDFVVLDPQTGSERLRVPLGRDAPTMSMIVPGCHDDVFVGRRSALMRIAQQCPASGVIAP